MIYTPLTKKALRICFDAHCKQVDKTGLPYVFHPFHLAEQMEDAGSVCVALLHDVVEDTDITFDQLAEEGFDQEVLDALKLLTHNDGSPYMEYVQRIKEDPIATRVKLADLRHNSDLTRLDLSVDKMPPKYELYLEAIKLLEG